MTHRVLQHKSAWVWPCLPYVGYLGNESFYHWSFLIFTAKSYIQFCFLDLLNQSRTFSAFQAPCPGGFVVRKWSNNGGIKTKCGEFEIMKKSGQDFCWKADMNNLVLKFLLVRICNRVVKFYWCAINLCNTDYHFVVLKVTQFSILVQFCRIYWIFLK